MIARCALACALLPTTALAHPGGTDSSGCHRETATGSRHCHGDNAEGVDARLTAEAALEIGSHFMWSGSRWFYHGSYHLQIDGTMLFLAGIGGGNDPMRPAGYYFDMSLGAAWIDQSEFAVAAQFGFGARVGLFDLGPRRRAFLKLGAFLDLIFVPGGKALGLNATFGVLL